MRDVPGRFKDVFAHAASSLVFAFSERVLQRQIPCPRALVAVRMASQENLVGMFSQFAVGLWRECSGPGLDGPGPALSSALLQLVACAYMRVPEAHPRDSLPVEHRRFVSCDR